MSRDVDVSHIVQVIQARLLAAQAFADSSAPRRDEVTACWHLLIRFFNEHDVSNDHARRLIAMIENAA